MLARRASTWSRDSFRRRVTAPFLSRPMRWNVFLPMSMPSVATASRRSPSVCDSKDTEVRRPRPAAYVVRAAACHVRAGLSLVGGRNLLEGRRQRTWGTICRRNSFCAAQHQRPTSLPVAGPSNLPAWRSTIWSPAITSLSAAAEVIGRGLIRSPIDQNSCAHWRNPVDMMRQG